MCAMETIWLENCPNEFKPIYYRRYVDDTFLIFRRNQDVELFLNYLNNQHDNIKFTYEKESNGCLSFLDVRVEKSFLGFKTSIYLKPTYTGLGLSWFSFCPDIYKINSIKTLLHRAYDICSDYFILHLEFEFLKRYFTNNNYSINIFFKVLKNFMYDRRKDKASKMDVPKMVQYIKLPFYGKVSYDLRKKLNQHLKYNFPAIDFRFVFSNNFTIGSFFNAKDKIPNAVCSKIVYEFSCPSCPARYIGCTTRSFKIRIFEHIGKSFRTGMYLSRMSFSAVREHSLEADHVFSDRDFKIIARFQNDEETFIGEKLLIQKLRPELNT